MKKELEELTVEEQDEELTVEEQDMLDDYNYEVWKDSWEYRYFHR